MKTEIITDKDGTPMINLDTPKKITIIEIIKVEKIVDWLNDIFGVKFYEDEEAKE